MITTAVPYYNDPYEDPNTGRIYTTIFEFAGAETIDYDIVYADTGLFAAQTLFIDVSRVAAPNAFTLEIIDTGVVYRVLGRTQAFLPALVGNTKSHIRGTLGVAGIVHLHFLTTRISPMQIAG